MSCVFQHRLKSIVLAALSASSPFAMAGDGTWSCVLGEYATATCWSPTGLPTGAGQVNGGAVVTYGETSGTQAIQQLTLGGPDGFAQMSQSAGQLNAGVMQIGAVGSALYRMRNTAVLTPGELTIGKAGALIMQSGTPKLGLGSGKVTVQGVLSANAGTLDLGSLQVLSGGSVSQGGSNVTVRGRTTIESGATYTFLSGFFRGFGDITNKGTLNQPNQNTLYSLMTNQGTYNLAGTHMGGLVNSSGGILNLRGGDVFGDTNHVSNLGLIEGYGSLDSDNLINAGTIITRNGNIGASGKRGIVNTGTIRVSAGTSFGSNNLSNQGAVDLINGSLGGRVNNGTSGRIQGFGTISAYLANSGTLSVSGGALTLANPLSNEGTVTLTARGTELNGAAVTNLGKLNGTGTVRNEVVNKGQIETLNTQELRFSGSLDNQGGSIVIGNQHVVTMANSLKNSGLVRVANGTLNASGPGAVVNSTEGVITAQGILQASSGWRNQGVMSFTRGYSNVIGKVVNEDGGVVLAEAGAIVNNINNFEQSAGGTLIAQSGSIVNFAGALIGAGTFTGGGALSLQNIVNPGGDGFANMVLDVNTTVSAIARFDMQIGGTAGHDRISFVRAVNLQNPTLQVRLANGYSGRAGDAFDLIDANTDMGFGNVSLPSLAAGLVWDTSGLGRLGVLRVVQAGTPIQAMAGSVAQIGAVPEPETWALALVGLLVCGARRRRFCAQA